MMGVGGGLVCVPLGVAALIGDEEEVDDLAYEEEASGEEPDDACDPAAGVEAVNAKEAEEAEEPKNVAYDGVGVLGFSAGGVVLWACIA